MLYVVHCIDFEDALPRRLANYDAHKQYLASATVKTVISGPLVAKDGVTMIGSMFIVDAERLEDVVSFNRNDPFQDAHVWADTRIHPFLMRVDNRALKID
ncbi:YciI family protein [Ochrobactrum sp. Q0168]|uniref:YciI family protein n=1 Tax=Ochrobactrum sp. Q0168 TaxID=2793241 RepID=UPI0018ECE3D4|nr:YciI family protein [Ochrobactrum sp. Q0168]